MRVTHQGMINNAIQHMASNKESIARLQNKIAAGKQNLAPSDDPVATSQSLSMRSTLVNLQAYRNTTDLARDWMDATDFSLSQLQTANLRAINLVTRGLNDTMGSDERMFSLATEIDAIIAQVVQIGNTSHKGEYIFAGYQIHTQPFPADYPASLTYNGDNGVLQRSVGPGQNVTLNIPGENILRPLVEGLVAARDALRAVSYNPNALQTALEDLQSYLDTLESQRTTVGARIRQVQAAADGIEKTDIELKSLLSKKEDLNYAEAISLLRGQEATYQAVMEVSGRAISALSLFDYLR